MFEKFKCCIVSVPMLKICNGSTDTWVEVHTDASAKALGAVLLQKCAAAIHFHPVAYYCKKFNNT